MWPTEEYAMRAFISVCRRQIILVIAAPHTASLEIIKFRFRLRGWNIKVRRRRP